MPKSLEIYKGSLDWVQPSPLERRLGVEILPAGRRQDSPLPSSDPPLHCVHHCWRSRDCRPPPLIIYLDICLLHWTEGFLEGRAYVLSISESLGPGPSKQRSNSVGACGMESTILLTKYGFF